MFQIPCLPGAFYRKRCIAEAFKTEEWKARGDSIYSTFTNSQCLSDFENSLALFVREVWQRSNLRDYFLFHSLNSVRCHGSTSLRFEFPDIGRQVVENC
jgi:hypothetical protein